MLSFFQKKLFILFYLKYLIFFFSLIIFYGTFGIIYSQEGDIFSERYMNLANELRCPTCQGLSVKDSEAGFSNMIKGKILELIKIGKSDKEIKIFFVKRYGEWILRTPPKKGFNLVLWILPGIVIFIGLFWVLFRFSFWDEKKKERDLENLTPEEERRVMNDLERFEGN